MLKQSPQKYLDLSRAYPTDHTSNSIDNIKKLHVIKTKNREGKVKKTLQNLLNPKTDQRSAEIDKLTSRCKGNEILVD